MPRATCVRAGLPKPGREEVHGPHEQKEHEHGRAQLGRTRDPAHDGRSGQEAEVAHRGDGGDRGAWPPGVVPRHMAEDDRDDGGQAEAGQGIAHEAGGRGWHRGGDGCTGCGQERAAPDQPPGTGAGAHSVGGKPTGDHPPGEDPGTHSPPEAKLESWLVTSCSAAEVAAGKLRPENTPSTIRPWQCDIHHRPVKDKHELDETQHGQRPPPPWVWLAVLNLRLGDDHFRVTVADGRLDLARGGAGQPDAIIATGASTLRALVFGDRDLLDALRSGDLTLDGDRRAVARFVDLFPRPTPSQQSIA